MCSARVYPLEALMADCRAYFGATGRRVTFEYTLMAGVNDSPQHVRGRSLPPIERLLAFRFAAVQAGLSQLRRISGHASCFSGLLDGQWLVWAQR